MYSNFKKVFNKFSEYKASKDIGEKNHFLFIFFYPLILFFSNFYRLIFSYFYTIKLFFDNKKAKEFFGYKPIHSILNTFYWNEELNLSRYGRKGISKYISTGEYRLSNWWFLSMTSLKLYKNFGSFFTPICMIIWLTNISLNFINFEAYKFFPLILTLILCSSYFYSASFVFLNYNAMGWALYPLFILFLLKNKLLFAGIILLLIGLSSITVAFISSILSIVCSIYFINPYFLIILIPLFINFIRKLSYSSNFVDSIVKIAKLIGLYSSKKQTKYYRPINYKNLATLESLYFIITWGLYLFFFLVDGNTDYLLFFLLSVSFSLHVINNSIFRFADEQSIYMAMFTIGAISLIEIQSSLLLFIFWLAISPLPYLVSSDSAKSYSPLIEKPFKPFHIKPLVDIVLNFLSPIKKNSRILISLKDPENKYSNLFIPYRSLIELLHYSANISCMLSMPDTWAISTNNQSNSIGFWGEGPSEVIDNAANWKTEYAIIIQKFGTNLDEKWILEGFVPISEIDWVTYKSLFNGEIFFTGKDTSPPKWFLLKVPKI